MKHFSTGLLALFVIPAVADTLVLEGAKVYTGVSDGAENVSLVIEDGTIAYVGKDPARIPEAEVVSLEGKIVTPGLIDSFSTLGIEEVGLSTDAEDTGYEGTDMAAGVDPMLAFNYRSSLVPSFLDEGVTQVVLRQFPTTDVLAGQMSMVALDANFNRYGPPHGVLAYLGEAGRQVAGKSRAAALQRLRIALDEANYFRVYRDVAEERLLRDLSFPRVDLEVLVPLFEGNRRLVLYVDRAADIEMLLERIPEHLDIVLVGAREAWKVADKLVARDVSVIVNPGDNLPSSFDRLGVRLDQPAKLHEAGVRFAFMSEEIYTQGRMITQGAGLAVAYGLPWIEGLRALTLNAAEIWGVDDTGSLQKGKEATLVVWNADPLEVTSHAERVMIAGQWVERLNRQKLLRDRYSDIDDRSLPFGYR